MAFNLLKFSSGGRDFGRGDPPPRGSIEYAAVGDMWEPEPSKTISGGIWELSAEELDAGDRWCRTLARSVDYARRIHGDSVLGPRDAAEFTKFYAQWLAFSKKVGTWSFVERARSSTKLAFEELMARSKKLRDDFSRKGMALVPIPHMADLVLLLRGMPREMTTREMADKLKLGVEWGQEALRESETTSQWVRRFGITMAYSASLGPAGYLYARNLAAPREGDLAGLAAAVSYAQTAENYLKRAPGDQKYGRGEPVYDEFLLALTKIYVEAAGLSGIRETERTNTARLVDDLTDPKLPKSVNYLMWVVGAAGVGYLGWRWLTKKAEPPSPAYAVPDLGIKEEPK